MSFFLDLAGLRVIVDENFCSSSSLTRFASLLSLCTFVMELLSSGSVTWRETQRSIYGGFYLLWRTWSLNLFTIASNTLTFLGGEEGGLGSSIFGFTTKGVFSEDSSSATETN